MIYIIFIFRIKKIALKKELFICHLSTVKLFYINYEFDYEKSDIFSLGINILRVKKLFRIKLNTT